MPSLYIVLYQFGSATNAKNFVTNNSGIDATPATVTFASGIAEGSWVVTFPENLNQLPSGFNPVLTYNGNTQTYESFAPFLDLSTINVITIPDGTPIIYRGVPVTNLANGPASGVTGQWVPGQWNVQYIYPQPGLFLVFEVVNSNGFAGISAIFNYTVSYELNLYGGGNDGPLAETTMDDGTVPNVPLGNPPGAILSVPGFQAAVAGINNISQVGHGSVTALNFNPSSVQWDVTSTTSGFQSWNVDFSGATFTEGDLVYTLNSIVLKEVEGGFQDAEGKYEIILQRQNLNTQNNQVIVHQSKDGNTWTSTNIGGYQLKTVPQYFNGCWGVVLQSVMSIFEGELQFYDSFLISSNGYDWSTVWSDPTAQTHIMGVGIDVPNNQFTLAISDAPSVNIPNPVPPGQLPYPQFGQAFGPGPDGSGITFPSGWMWMLLATPQAFQGGSENFYLSSDQFLPEEANPGSDPQDWTQVLQFTGGSNGNAYGYTSFAIPGTKKQ